LRRRHAAADRTFDSEAAAKAIAPFLDERAVAVAHVDLTRLDVDVVAAWVVKLTKIKPEAIAEPQKFLAEAVKSLTKAGAKDLYFVMTIQQRGDDVLLRGRAGGGRGGRRQDREAFTAISRMTEVLASRRSTRTW